MLTVSFIQAHKTVQLFEFLSHPTAKKCYAWFYVVDNSGKKKFVALLHQEPVVSPKNRVKVFIIGEYRET